MLLRRYHESPEPEKAPDVDPEPTPEPEKAPTKKTNK